MDAFSSSNLGRIPGTCVGMSLPDVSHQGRDPAIVVTRSSFSISSSKPNIVVSCRKSSPVEIFGVIEFLFLERTRITVFFMILYHLMADILLDFIVILLVNRH